MRNTRTDVYLVLRVITDVVADITLCMPPRYVPLGVLLGYLMQHRLHVYLADEQTASIRGRNDATLSRFNTHVVISNRPS